jgi:hypothetical protein
MDGRDRHLSQPIRAADVSAAADESDEERVQRKTHEQAVEMTWQRIDRHLTEHIRLTQETNLALGRLSQDHVSKSGLLEMKDIRQEMRVMRESNAGVLEGLRDAVDELRSIRELIQHALTNGYAPQH